MSWLSDLLGMGSNTATDWYENSDFLGPLITTGVSTIGALARPDSTPYSQSEDYLNQQLALERDKFAADEAYKQQALAQALEIAKMNAGGAGASASAARYAAQLSAATRLAELKNRSQAEMIKNRIENNWGRPEIQQKYAADAVQALKDKAAMGQAGFNSAANFLAGARRQ